MPTCHHLAPNREKSLLYQGLEQKYGPDKAHDLWEQVRSQQFLNKYGDWTSDHVPFGTSSGIELDANGEPTVREVEQKLGLVEEKQVFKPANQEQVQAIAAIQDFIRKGDPGEWLMVQGKAGTGKTTIVQEAIAPFVKNGDSILIAALAHKAKLVLATKLEARFGKKAISSHTIAGALAMGMDNETGKFSPEFGSAFAEKPVEQADIIIVDEASMINEEALELIMEHKRIGTKVIFLGDIGQLPPIRDEHAQNADAPSPTFTTKNIATLTERVRQGEESPILPYADLFWDNSQSKHPQPNPAPQEQRKSAISTKGSLVFAKSSTLLPKVMPFYKKAVETGNPDLIKTVVYRNATRQLINQQVRKYVFGEGAKQFERGDIVMFQDNYKVGRETISNSTEVQIKDAVQKTTDDGWKVWMVDMAFEGKPTRLPVLDASETERFNQHVSKMFSDAKGMQAGSQQRAKAMQAAWNEKKRFAPIDYAYAITSHKSQGSTYDMVLVGEADIMGVTATTAKAKSQSIYTALTRARHAAFIMDGKNDNPGAVDAAIYMLQNRAKPGDPAPEEEEEETEDVTPPVTTTATTAITAMTPADYTNHSGGAEGSDAYWDIIGRTFGVVNHNHYREPASARNEKSPAGWVDSSKLRAMGIKSVDLEESTHPGVYTEGQQKATVAARQMGRIEQKHQVRSNYLIRNWAQVKYADAIYALGTIIEPGTPIDHGKTALIEQVKGGTGYAVQMAINEGKPVYVYDGKQLSWFKFDYGKKKFVRTDTPVLTKNFAGIGSRSLSSEAVWQNSIQAVKDVYTKTLANPATAPGPVPKPKDIFEDPKQFTGERVTVTKEVGVKGKRTAESTQQVKDQIQAIYAEARANPEKIYRIPYEANSQSQKFSNNFGAQELANLFDDDNIPQNVEFSESFRKLVENSFRRVLAGFKSDTPVEFIGYEREKVLETAASLLVPKYDGKGNQQGFFSPEQQKEIVDSIVTMTERRLRKNPIEGANSVLQVFRAFRGAYQQEADRGNIERSSHFFSMWTERERLAEEALRQLEGLGLHTDEPTVERIKSALREVRPLTPEEQADWRDRNPDVDPETLDEFTGEFIEAEGRIARDWSDNTFELDPRDTASARIKMFIGTVFDMDRAVYRADPAGVQVQGLPTDSEQLKALAKEVSRRGIWYKDAATSEKLAAALQSQVPLLPKENFLGIGKTADYDQVFKQLLNTLGDKPQGLTIDQAIGMLLSHTSPTIQYLAKQLQVADQSVKNEFMTVMMKQYQPFVMALFNTTIENGQEHYVLRPIEANRFNQKNTLIKYWQEQQKLEEITKIDASGERVLDIQRIRERWLPILEKLQKINDWSKPENRDYGIQKVKNIFKLLGIHLTEEMVADLFDNTEKWTKGSTLSLFGKKANGEPTGLVSLIIMKAAGLSNLNEQNTLEEGSRLSQLNNPLYTEMSSMKILAGLAAKYTPVLYSENHRNSEGKSVWDWGMNTKLSHQFRQLRASFADFDALAQQETIAKDNYVLQYFRENPAQLEDAELAYFDGLKPTWGKKGTTRGDMSDREQLLTSILLFQNQGWKTGHYMSLTHSDKTMTPVFRNMPKVNVGRDGILPYEVVGRSDSYLYRVFKSEYDRITQHANIDSGSAQYEKGKGLFYFLPEFNFDGMVAMVAAEVITQNEMDLIYPAGQPTLTQSIDSEKELPVINKILTYVVENLAANTLQTWQREELVTEDQLKFDKKYITNLMYNAGIKSAQQLINGEKTQIYFDSTGASIDRKAFVQIMARTAAKDYAINQFLFNTALSQLFYGDPAEAYKKSKAGNTQVDQMKSTMTEYAKRLAKDIAPRTDLYWGDKRTYNAITLSEVLYREHAYDDIQVLKKAYNDTEIESTNAQELTTVQEHLDVLNAAGKIPYSVYTEMSGIVAKAKSGYYEFTKPEHLAVIMQPQKPLYAGKRQPVNGVRLTDYIKTSSYPLYPPFTRGREIDSVRQLMEKGNIQRAAFDTGQKLGNPHRPLRLFDPTGKFLKPDAKILAAAIRPMDRGGFGIQQDVPYDESKEAIKVISQMNENIVEGIEDIQGFKVSGHGTMDGRQLRDFKENLRKQMIDYNRRKFDIKLNIDEDGNVDPEQIYDVMVREAQRDTTGKYSLNEIQSLLIRDTDGTPMIPLMFSTAAAKYESLLMGMVNHISEVKIPGKSYVQASSTGYKLVNSDDADLSQVIWIGSYDGGNLKPMRLEDGQIKPGQVIIPFNFFRPDGSTLDVEEFLIERDGKKYLDPTKVPQELLQLIGARIPNQKYSSMHPLEVVGFVPRNMGDIVLIPSALVTQMGGDFDVDKLYTYKRPYYYNKDTGELIPQRNYTERLGADDSDWQSLKEDTTAKLKADGVEPGETGFYEKAVWNKALAQAVADRWPDGNVPKHIVPKKKDQKIISDIEELQNDYFNVHWAVLTHKEMLTKVMAPLDMPDIGNESKTLKETGNSFWNAFDPMNQLQDFQSGKDAKRLVGTTSWATKMTTRMQGKNLRYGVLQLKLDPVNDVETWEQVPGYITVRDEHTGQLRQIGRLSGTATSLYSEKDGDATNVIARSKVDNHVAVQSESVDNAKTRNLDNLNLTPDTYKAVQALIELQTEPDKDGLAWAPSAKYWTRLITQPVIRYFSRMMKQGNDSLSKAYDPNLYQTVYTKLENLLNDTIPDLERGDVDRIVFDPQTLLKAQTLNKTDKVDYAKHQLAALRLFDKLYKIGDRLFQLEALFTQDVGGAGKDMFTAMQRAQSLGDIDRMPILNARELYVQDSGGLTETGHVFNQTVGTALNVIPQILPYRGLQSLFNRVQTLSGRAMLTMDQQRTILKALRSAAYTTGQHWWKDAQQERVRLMYGENSLANQVAIAQKTWGLHNPFLQRLSPHIADNENEPDAVQYNAAAKTLSTDRQNMTTGWLHLLVSQDEEQRRLGEDLLRYAFLTGGIQDANSFIEFVPQAYIAGTEITSVLKDIERELKESTAYENEGLVAQIIQHNPEMAYQVDATVFPEMEKDREFPETFQYDEEDETHNNLVNEGALRPYISFRSRTEGKWILYALNEMGESKFYTRIDTLGNKYSDEYNGEAESGQRSIFQDNRSLADQVSSSFWNMENNSYTDDFSQVPTTFESLGIKEGSGLAVQQHNLAAISDNIDVPEYLRTVADLYRKVEDTPEFLHSVNAMQELGAPRKFERSVRYDGGTGPIASANILGDIHLRSNKRMRLEFAALAYLHETTHQNLLNMILLAGYDDRRMKHMEVDEYSKFLELGNRFTERFPQVAERIHRLEQLRYQAFNRLREELGSQEFYRVANKVERGQVEDANDLKYYAASTLQEFVAHVATDPDIARWLNSIETEDGRTLLQQLWDMFTDIITAFAEALGVPVKDGSVFKESLGLVLSLQTLNMTRNLDLTTPIVEGGQLQVKTEREAVNLWDMFDFTYDKEGGPRNEGTHWTVNVSNEVKTGKKKRTTSVPGQRGKIIDELYKQRDDIHDAIGREKDTSTRVQLMSKYREVREHINEIQQENNLDRIAEVGKKQLKWVDETLKKEAPTMVELNLAIRTAQLWENLIEILYTGLEGFETKESFDLLSTRAQKLRMRLVDSKAQKALIEAYKGDVPMTAMDFHEKLQDIDVLSANTLSLTRAKPKLVSATAAAAWREANNRDEHIYRNTVRLQALEKKMKATGLKDADLIDFDEETGQWGLINRLSLEWHNHIKTLRLKLNTQLDTLEKSETLKDDERKAKRKEIWNEYWSKLKEDAVFVDTRAFFDTRTGARKSGPEVDTAFQSLVKSTGGSEDYAKELLQKAEEKYKRYTMNREAYSEYLDSELELTKEEMEGKTLEERDKLWDKKKSEAMKKWLQYNSPVDLLERLDKGKNINFNSEGDQWLVITPKTGKPEFFSQNYHDLSQDPKKLAVYNEYRQILTEMQSYLPMEIQSKIPDNFLPLVPKETAGFLATIMDKIRNWDTEMLRAIAATDAEEASRLRPDKIPVQYVTPTGYTKEVENRSTDLIRVLELFSMMALQHRYMGNVLDTVNVAEAVLKQANQKRLAGLEEGGALRHVLDALQYFRDKLIYKKPVELGGKVEDPVYTINPAKQIKIQREVKALMKEKEDLKQKISDNMLEGDWDSEEENKRLEVIDKQLSEYEAMARNIYGSKVVDAIISLNAMKALAFAPGSTVTNFTFAEISLQINARGRVDFDPKTLGQAKKIMIHSVKKYFAFQKEGDPVAQKVHALMQRMGIMGDITDRAWGNNSNLKRGAPKIKAFGWLEAGDYFTKGELMVAMMLKKKVKVGDKEISLWDAFDNEGKWNEAEYGPAPEWYSEDIHNQTEWNRFRDYTRKISMMIFGNQDKNAPLMAKKNWLLRVAAQFRLSWFPEGIASRWKDEYYDPNLRRNIKGRWKTYKDLGIVNSGVVLAKQMLSVLPGVKTNPFEGVTLKDGKPLSDSAHDMENMRKNFSGLAWTVGFTLTILMLESLGRDDEHKKDANARRRQLLINMLIRNYQDLTLYSSPSVFDTVSGNFFPATGVITDYIKAMKASGHYFFGDTEHEKNAFDRWMRKMFRAGIPHPVFSQYNKMETMMTRDIDKLQR